MYNAYKNIEMTKEGYLLGVEYEEASKCCAPGQYFEVSLPGDPRMVPVILTDILPDRGIIKVVFRPINETTKAMAALPNNGKLNTVEGPYGKHCPFLEEDVSGKKFLVVAEDLGGAAAYLMIHDLKKKGAVVDAVAGGRTKGCLYLSEFTGELCHQYINLTEDGTQGEKGTICGEIDRILGAENYDVCVVLGYVSTLETVAKAARARKVKTWVSLDPTITGEREYKVLNHIIVDGQCKSIREDGTMFDADGIDFEELKRQL